MVVPAVPAIAADLNSYGHLSWIISAYLLTSTAATPIYGKLSDLYGRRALLLPAIVWFVFASVLCGFARSLPQLVVFRALQGIGGGGLLVMAQASIADVVAPRERGRYQAYISGVWAAASIAGPVLGGWVTDAASWRWIFWLNVPIGAAAFVLSDRALEDAEGAPGQGAHRLCRRSAADRRDHLPAADLELGRRKPSHGFPRRSCCSPW